VGLRCRAFCARKEGLEQKAVQLHAKADALVTGILGYPVEANAAAESFPKHPPSTRQAPIKHRSPHAESSPLNAEFVGRCVKGLCVAPIPSNEKLAQLLQPAQPIMQLLQLARAHKLLHLAEHSKSRGAHINVPEKTPTLCCLPLPSDAYRRRDAEELARLLRAVRDAGVVGLRERAVRSKELGAEQEAVQLHEEADELVAAILTHVPEHLNKKTEFSISPELVARCLSNQWVLPIPDDKALARLARLAGKPKANPLRQLAKVYKLEWLGIGLHRAARHGAHHVPTSRCPFVDE
jgi:hypothetical protein